MIIAIVQARMSSTRLPGKSMMVLAGKPALGWVIQRLSGCRTLDRVVVATSEHKEDDVIADYCKSQGVDCFRGSEADVLDRYYQCAMRYNPSAVVRITGDCPLIDPEVVDECVKLYLDQKTSNCYVSNGIERTYPDGLDVEVFSMPMLEDAWRNATLASDHEHATQYMLRNWPQVHLKIGSADYSKLRLTLDHPEDAVVIRTLLESLAEENPLFGLREMVEYFNDHPEVEKINAHFDINEGLAKSLKEDYVFSKQ